MSYSKPIIENKVNDSPQGNSEVVVIGERRFPLNKSRSKYISVGLSRDDDFEPCIILCGNKGDSIRFNEQEWLDFLNYQGVITNYLYSNDAAGDIHCGKIFLSFEQISFARVVKIWKNGSYVYLGYETVCKLWELLPLVKYRIGILKQQQFMTYFSVLKRGLEYQGGNLFVNASRILHVGDICPTENVCLALELMHLYPDTFEEECAVRV